LHHGAVVAIDQCYAGLGKKYTVDPKVSLPGRSNLAFCCRMFIGRRRVGIGWHCGLGWPPISKATMVEGGLCWFSM